MKLLLAALAAAAWGVMLALVYNERQVNYWLLALPAALGISGITLWAWERTK